MWGFSKSSLLLAFLGVLALGYAAVNTEIGRALTGRWSFVKSVEEDRGTYYRLKVKLAYKGEPQDFDIVVGCNAKQTNYKDGGRTVEVGLVPQVFGRRMSDGKGLVISPPQACKGETTANGRVQPDLLPLVIVYDDARNFAFGTAYLSEDAYENPLSVLTFGGATIEAATRAQFDEFRRIQPNAVPGDVYNRHLAEGAVKKQPTDSFLGSSCIAYARYRLPEDLRALVRAHWPEERPRFWQPSGPQAQAEIEEAARRSKALRSDDPDGPRRTWAQFVAAVDPFLTNYGLVTRRGGGQVMLAPGHAFPPALYPDIDGWGALPWPEDPPRAAERILAGDVRIETNLDFREGVTKGFGYCREDVTRYAGLHSPPEAKRLEMPVVHYWQKPASNRVDGREIRSPQKGRLVLFVENDEFVFHLVQFGLFSIRGDV